jgi:hypothetical protein
MTGVVTMSKDILLRRTRLLGEEHISTVESAARYGMALFYSGDASTAAGLLESAYTMMVGSVPRQGLNIDSIQSTSILLCLAEFHYRALPHIFRESASQTKTHHTSKHRPDAHTRKAGKFENLHAREMGFRAAEGFRCIQGEKHPDTLYARRLACAWLSTNNELEIAVASQSSIVEDLRRLNGRLHPFTLMVETNLAFSLAHSGHLAQAEAQALWSYESNRAAFGAEPNWGTCFAFLLYCTIVLTRNPMPIFSSFIFLAQNLLQLSQLLNMQSLFELLVVILTGAPVVYPQTSRSIFLSHLPSFVLVFLAFLLQLLLFCVLHVFFFFFPATKPSPVRMLRLSIVVGSVGILFAFILTIPIAVVLKPIDIITHWALSLSCARRSISVFKNSPST